MTSGMRYLLVPLLLSIIQSGYTQELSGLIVKYTMDNACELVDEMPGSPVNGVLNDVVIAPGRGNVDNTALAFNLNTSYITLGVVEKLKLTGDHSISFWIKPTITGADRSGSIFTYSNAIVIGYLEQSSVPKLNLRFGNTQYQVVDLSNQWQTVTVTFEKNYSSTKSKASVYINGLLVNENEQNKSTADFSNAIVLMGPVNQNTLTNGFRGTLDDMRIYDRALSTEEVLNAVLPVKLEFFNAKRNKSTVELSWKTSIEQNFSHFNIQRSADGIQFAGIKKVDGGKNNYLVYDAAKPDTDVWYRLEMVDNDGKKEYSNIVRVSRDTTPQPTAISVFPNPASETIYFRGLSPNNTVNIINATGTLVKQKRSVNEVYIADIAPGLYYIVIYDQYGNKQLVSKFIKRRSG